MYACRNYLQQSALRHAQTPDARAHFPTVMLYSLRCFFSRFLDVHKIFTCTMAYQHKKLANCKWIQMKYIFCTSHRRLTFRNFTFFRFFFFFNLKFWFISCSMLLGWAVMYHKKKNKMRTDENVLQIAYMPWQHKSSND